MPRAVAKATVWTDTVKRGDMAIERRGAGQLFETESGELAVQVRVPESRSLDLEIGQTAVVDLHVDTAPARVSGLDDRIVQGTRLVYLEITAGLEEGDQIVLSDMSRGDSVDRVAMR